MRLLPVCLSCLNQRLGSATSALSPSYKGMCRTNAWRRVTFTAGRVSDSHCKRRAHTSTHTSPTTWPGRQSRVILKQHWCPFLPEQWASLCASRCRQMWKRISSSSHDILGVFLYKSTRLGRKYYINMQQIQNCKHTVYVHTHTNGKQPLLQCSNSSLFLPSSCCSVNKFAAILLEHKSILEYVPFEHFIKKINQSINPQYKSAKPF